MSALTTAFAESGHGGPIPKIAPSAGQHAFLGEPRLNDSNLSWTDAPQSDSSAAFGSPAPATGDGAGAQSACPDPLR
jgi:hypothetical protein